MLSLLPMVSLKSLEFFTDPFWAGVYDLCEMKNVLDG